MKILFNIINRFIEKKPNIPIYGRWRLDYEISIQDRKVYLTNMDNCGCCEMIESSTKSKHKSQEELTDDYLLPYIL